MTFAVGDNVWLSTRNLKSSRPSKMLDYKCTGPYTVSKIINKTPAKCESVQEQLAILSDTPGDLTSASKYFLMLPVPPGAKQSALRLCKRILRCSRKHLQLWRCIQDATRFDLQNSQILELLRPLRRSAGDFERS